MNDSPEMEWFKNAYREHLQNSKDSPDWKVHNCTAIFRKQTGDIDGAIEATLKSINITRTIPALSEETALSLNYLADLHLLKTAEDQAEEVLRESINLSRSRYPLLHADGLWILAGIQSRKGEYREALVSALEARELYQRHDHPHGVARAEEVINRIRTNLETAKGEEEMAS